MKYSAANLRNAIAINMFTAAALIAQWHDTEDADHEETLEMMFRENRIVRERLTVQLREAQRS